MRVLRREEHGYTEEVLVTGTLALETLGGIQLETEWVLVLPPPHIRARVDVRLAEG